MNSPEVSKRVRVFLLLNWLVFALCFAWVAHKQHSLTWWTQLNWHTWLADLDAIVQLGKLQASTFWILWFTLSIFFTIVCLPRRAATLAGNEDKTTPSAKALLETDPLLQEKILRLRQSLDNIR